MCVMRHLFAIFLMVRCIQIFIFIISSDTIFSHCTEKDQSIWSSDRYVYK